MSSIVKRIAGLLLLLPTLCWADGQLNNTFTATGTSITIPLFNTGIGYHKLTFTTSGTVTTCSVQLDSSADGTTWNAGAVIGATTCTSNGATSVTVLNVVNYVRIDLTTFSGSGSVSVVWNGYVNVLGDASTLQGHAASYFQINLSATAKTGSGTEVPGMTTAGLAAGDRVQYDGSKFVNAEPGVATNAQAGANYAILAGDKGKLITRTNAAMADTIAQAGTGSFDALWYTFYTNIHASVTATITPTTSTCNGAAACTVLAGEGGILISDGANYRFLYFPSVTPGTGIITSASLPAVEHVISFQITASGAVGVFIPVYFACTIYAVDVTADQSGSFAMDIWKANAAIPAAGNKISGTDGPALSAAQLNLNHTPSGWSSTTVSSGDVFGGTVGTFTTVTNVHVQLRCH